MDKDKTNVLRLLDQAGIEYSFFDYDPNETDGEKVAKLLNEDPDTVFKTLVCVGNDLNHYVFVVPVNQKLNLKKGAKAVGVKNIEMIKQKELFPLTGYVHGGCSPIGMKKKFVTIINETAMLFDNIFVSAGKLGKQVKINPNKLLEYIDGKYEEITD